MPQDFDFLGRNAFQRRYAPGEPVVLKGTLGDALFVVRPMVRGGFTCAGRRRSAQGSVAAMPGP